MILCAGLTSLSLYYRIVEIPDAPEPVDFPAFVAGFPTPEENKAGRLIRTGCTRLEDELKTLPIQRPRRLQGNAYFLSDCAGVPLRGWPNHDKELANWLDDVFEKDWWKPLVEASREPIGVVEDPRRLNYLSPMKVLEAGRTAARLLLRGLQLQKTKNDPAVFVDHFAVTISLVRNLQNRGPRVSVLVAQSIEILLMDALTCWLEQLDGRPDLLSRVAMILHQYRHDLPLDSHSARLADYLVGLNTLAQPDDWLQRVGLAQPDHDDFGLITGLWNVPWESVRRSRLLRALYWGDLDPRSLPQTAIRLFPAPYSQIRKMSDANPRRLVRLGIAELMIALRRYQADTGKPAERLDLLLPKYLEQIPEDPFSSQPLRYRLSRGEEIDWPEDNGNPAGAAAGGPLLAGQAARKVPAGQGILWSVGEDGRDDGGNRQGYSSSQSQSTLGRDFIFLVPLPARKKP